MQTRTLTTSDAPVRRAVFDLPFDVGIHAINFARMLKKEGFRISAYRSFSLRLQQETDFKKSPRYVDMDTVITVGDYSRRYRPWISLNSINIDVSSLENELHAMWLVMVLAGIGTHNEEEEVAYREVVKPFLTAFSNHRKGMVGIAAGQESYMHTEGISGAFRSIILHNLLSDRLMKLAAQDPTSIHAQILAKIDSIPG